MENHAHIINHVEDRIATITMNRPQKLNAIDDAIDDDMVRGQMAAMDRFDREDEAHTAILCGNGRASIEKRAPKPFKAR
jgi:enoyl-CoA hydratase